MDHVEMWKLRRRLEYLEAVRPVGQTSVVTVLIRPDDHMVRIRNTIADEHNKANNVKSAQNRSSVQEGLRSIGEYLKMYKVPPTNGIACYYGSAIHDPITGREKRLRLYFEPPRPIRHFLYHCDAQVQTGPLRELLRDQEAIGFIVIDGKGALFAVVRGNEKEIKCRFSVDLPRKHSRGGQSAMRFARQREELRKRYLLQVCDKATTVYITDDRPNVVGLILAGQAQFKDELEKSPHLDQRLRAIVRLTVTVAYGDHQGLDETIKLSAEILGNLRLAVEIKLLNEFMDLLHKGRDDMVAYGINSTIFALQEGAVAKLIVWENLGTVRYLMKNPSTEEQTTEFLPCGQLPCSTDLELIEAQPLIEWLADHAHEFGSRLELVSDRSNEGAMLKLGFNGIAALLRYSRVADESCDLSNEDFSNSHDVFLNEY